MSIDERPRGFTRPTHKLHYNSLPTTSPEGALGSAHLRGSVSQCSTLHEAFDLSTEAWRQCLGALGTVRERYTRGEISREEFEQMKCVLEE